MEPTRHSIRCPNLLEGNGRHELVYYDWGDPMADNTVVCVHGLTRNARDFDGLAAELAKRGNRVLCLSMAGRGESEWLKDPIDYNYASYAADCLRVLDNFHLRQVDWVGTSMGGILGMLIASQHPGRIRKLVLNDIGTLLKADALKRIYAYVQATPEQFSNKEEAEAFLRVVFEPFGIVGTDIWHGFVEHSLIALPDGAFKYACDPRILDATRSETQNFTQVEDVNIAELWDRLFIPALIIRGELSDILDTETVSAMRATNPRATSVTIPGVGHAPALASREQITMVANWLMQSGFQVRGI